LINKKQKPQKSLLAMKVFIIIVGKLSNKAKLLKKYYSIF